jgi:signal transduction histidine kinase
MTVDRLLEKLTATIRQLLNVDIADVRLIGAQKWLDLFVSSDQRVERFGEGGGFNGASQWVINQRRSIAIRDFPAQTEFPLGGVVEKFGIRGFLAAPLTARSGEVIGVIRALSKEPRDFSAQEIDLFEQLANGAAVALVNEQLYTESQKASRAKSEFLCVMSHELRTPLNIIMGYAALVKDDLDRASDARHCAWLETIQAQARELQDMFDAIMQATAIESGSTRANFDQVDCSGLLQDLQETHAHRAKKKVAVIWNYPVDLPPLRTDPAKLRWILHNLIKNAIKFTDQGSVTVRARLRARTNRTNKESAKQKSEETKNGRMGERRNLACLEVSVTDTGIGIAKENLPIIFDIFRQADSSDTRAYGGAGLGLYIVKKLTEVLGGTVDVQSVLGKGSTFVVSIPCEPLRIVARPADTRTSARQSEGKV